MDPRQQFPRCLRSLRWIDSQHRLQQRDQTCRDVSILQLLERELLGLFCRNFSERAPNKWHTARKQIPKGDAEGVDVRTRIEPHFSRLSKLLWTCKSRSADETGLRLFRTAFRLRRQNFRDPIINYFNNGSAARIRLQHDIGWFNVAMHNAACFGGGQSACTLLNHFKRETERHRALTPDLGLKRFALDQFHNVKTFTVLFAVVTDTRDIRMANLRSRARFAQEARSRPGVLCDYSVDYFKRDDGIQHCVARAISYRHCSRAELDRKAVRADFHFKVIVLQRPRCQSSAVRDFFRLLAIA